MTYKDLIRSVCPADGSPAGRETYAGSIGRQSVNTLSRMPARALTEGGCDDGV